MVSLGNIPKLTILIFAIKQIRTNRLLPKGSDYFDLVEMIRLELTTYTLRTYRSTG